MNSSQQRPTRDAATMVAQLVRLAAVLTAAIGVIVLVGWVFSLPLLKSVLPGAVEMKANTAVGLMLAGCALFILGDRPSPPLQRLAQVLALAVGALGLATLGEYLFGWHLGIDELLFRDTADAYNVIPGRMSPYSAVAFASIGLALAVLPRPSLRPLAWSAATVMTVIGALSFLGYVWNASELVTDRWLPPVAVNTAVAFILLSVGTLFAIHRPVTQQGSRPIALAPVEKKILAGFIGALLLLLVAGGFTYRSSVQFTNSAQLVSHTQEVRSAIAHLYADISDAESAQRTYLITGQHEEFDNYTRLAAKIKDQQEAIARLVADNPNQLRNLAELRQLIDRFIDLTGREIILYQQQGFASAKELINSAKSYQSTVAIDTLTERMDALEAKLLTEREAAFTRVRLLILISLLFTLVGATIVFTLLYRGIRREMVARHEAEKALIVAKEAADTANRAKSTFLATMSHEIRTPMNAVLGMLELLSLTKLDTEQRTALEIVRESGRSLLRIIDDILDFSKIEADKLEFRPEVTSIAKVIEGVFNIYSGNASSKGLLLKRSTDPEISPAVWVDPLRLQQMLNNFVSNALKFTSQGTIEIKAKLVERADGEDRVRFSVKDTGIGVSAENQQQLFQPFMQAEGDTTRRFGGTGLGLTICKRLADMIGGSIEMVSELGKGTTMILTLSMPIADPKELTKTDPAQMQDLARATVTMRRIAPSVAQAETEGTLVLLVDDHPINRMVLEYQVQVLGYTVESAENGAEALDKWKSGRFAIVITDCNMPEMDGYELARSIRKLESENGRQRTPIIAYTANALGGEAEKCFAAGMSDYLVKPVELTELLKKLDKWLPIAAAGATLSEQPIQQSGTPEPDAATPVDRSVLAANSGGDAAVERDILIDFRRINDEDAAMLKHAVAKSDIPQVTRSVHRIKGASKIVGALELASVCERIEQASRANDWTSVKANMGAFHQEWIRLNVYFDSFLGRTQGENKQDQEG